MNVPAILEALEDCPGLIANKLTDSRGHYCVLGWLIFKASDNPEIAFLELDLPPEFGLAFDDEDTYQLVDFNNRHYRSRKARLEAVRGYVAAQAAAQDGGR